MGARHDVEVMRPIETGRCIDRCARALERAEDRVTVRRIEALGALEHHVFKHVTDARLPGTFVPTSDLVGHIHRHDRNGSRLPDKHIQSIVELVLVDAIHGFYRLPAD